MYLCFEIPSYALVSRLSIIGSISGLVLVLVLIGYGVCVGKEIAALFHRLISFFFLSIIFISYMAF